MLIYFQYQLQYFPLLKMVNIFTTDAAMGVVILSVWGPAKIHNSHISVLYILQSQVQVQWDSYWDI